MAKKQELDRELEEYRGIMQPPATFDEGFNWNTLFGALFVGLLMVPGAVYMGLLAGQGIGPAASWVTVILFIEVARRMQRNLKKAEVFVLFYMVGAAMAMPFGGLHWNQFFIRSESAIAYGIADQLPAWFAPPLTSDSYIHRTFLHKDWLPVIGLVIFGTFFGRLSWMVMGYGFFRITSDIEKLPFPMAPVGAAGTMALAEDIDSRSGANAEGSWKWRVFSIGGAIGLAFGFIYLLLPTLSAALTGTPIQIIPIPWVEWTPKTAKILPAVATGIDLNLMNFIWGMVVPFSAMVGKMIGLAVTFIANPILYKYEILKSWTPGDNTVITMFKTSLDFYFSFSIGISAAIAGVGVFKVVQAMRERKKMRELHEAVDPGLTKEKLKERGDIPPWLIFGSFFVITLSYILLSGWLIDWHPGVMAVLFFFGFVYTPLISYVSSRLEGIAGMQVTVPYLYEASLILSGYEGVKIWFLPIPRSGYSDQPVLFYRQCELTGTKFSSIWKTEALLTPIILVASIVYMSYIWGLAEIPSGVYPFAQQMWELQAANNCIMYSATLGEYSIFEEAFRWSYLLIGAGSGVLLFGLMSWLSAPVFLTYGVIQGVGQTIPHALFLQFGGALVGQYYFYKRMGLLWRQYAPVLAAGFSCGFGLIGTVGVGIVFLTKAVIQMPF